MTPDEPPLSRRIAARQARIAILGLGSVGIPLARAFVRAGFPVLGFDVDVERARQVGAGERPLAHLPEDLAAELARAPRFRASADAAELAGSEVSILCVPTPLGPHREPDLSAVEAAAGLVARGLAPGSLVVLESTTFPSTTREVVAPILERSGLRAGEDFHLAYSPEREDPGRGLETRAIPKLVGGFDARSGELARALYAAAVERVHLVSSAEVAEAAKLLENIFRAVNIALVNELKVLLDAMGIDVWEVIEAAATKPFGFMKFTPGPGMGGHCIPVDPFYLTWIARKVGLPTRFIELAGEINRSMPRYVVERTLLALNEQGRSARGARILVLGLAYKPEVGIVTESPAIPIVARLLRLGAEVDYSDPWVPVAGEEAGPELAGRRSVELTQERLAAYDAVVLATHHAAFDLEAVARHARLVVDTRNALGERMRGDPRYFRA